MMSGIEKNVESIRWRFGSIEDIRDEFGEMQRRATKNTVTPITRRE